MPRVAEWRSYLTQKDAHGKDRPTTFGRWVRDMAQGSENTADENARKLVFYCRHVGLTPEAFAEAARKDPRATADELGDFIHDLTEKGKAGGYVNRYVVVVQSWLKWNEVTLPRKPKVRGVHMSPTLAEESVPTQAQLRQVLALATVRGRAATAMIAFTGVRPEVLGNMRGEDGFRLGDFPELALTGDEAPSFTQIPARVMVRAKLSKTKRPYMTFLPAEGCEIVLTYLRQRIAEGEKLCPETPLIISHERLRELRAEQRDGSPIVATDGFIWTRNVTREIREALRAAGIPHRPYVLRAYHNSALLMAESRQGFPHEYRTHVSGHVGSMDARYASSKGRLPVDLIEDMRKRYAKAASEFITTSGESLDDSAMQRVADLERKLADQARELEAARTMDPAFMDEIVARVLELTTAKARRKKA